MKIVHKTEAVHVSKTQSIEVDYYLFDDYEIHYNEQLPHTEQQWHHHEHISETLFVIDGELTAYWKEDDGIVRSERMAAGDLVETERTIHTFANEGDRPVRFMVVKRVSSQHNHRDLFQKDKVID